jgi:ATP-utilizing enzymes of the PP-loop superfamily
MICTKCVNDSSVSGIAFDDKGICSYCASYEVIKDALRDYTGLKKLWTERLEHYRGKGDYDALIGLSGGKDSTYVLYQLVHTYGLKVRAFTADNGFLTDLARERVDAIVKELKVDHSYITPDRSDLGPLYLLSIKLTGAPCTACAYAIYSLTISLASQMNIPMAVHGRSRPQMLRFFSDKSNDPFIPFIHSALQPLAGVNLRATYEKSMKKIESILPPHVMKSFMPFLVDFKEKEPVEFLPYFMYHPYDEVKMVQFLEQHMNWKRNQGHDILTHFDCAAHAGAGYLYEIAEGRPHVMPELSTVIREGFITREDALQRLQKEKVIDAPLESLDALAKYINTSPEELISIAKQIREARRSANSHIA